VTIFQSTNFDSEDGFYVLGRSFFDEFAVEFNVGNGRIRAMVNSNASTGTELLTTGASALSLAFAAVATSLLAC